MRASAGAHALAAALVAIARDDNNLARAHAKGGATAAAAVARPEMGGVVRCKNHNSALYSVNRTSLEPTMWRARALQWRRRGLMSVCVCDVEARASLIN